MDLNLPSFAFVFISGYFAALASVAAACLIWGIIYERRKWRECV